MINPMRSQPTRMMGLASGMDTDFIIQQTMRMHQFRIDNQMRNRTLIEWRQQTHTTIKNEITSLRQTFLSNLGTKTMMNRNAFNSTRATVSGNNTNAVTIRTTSGSPLGNFNIQGVAQLAKGAHLTTAAGVTGANGNGFASGTRLNQMEFEGGGEISWTRLGGTIRVGNDDIKIENTSVDGTGDWTFKRGNTDITDNTDIIRWNNDEKTSLTIISSNNVERTLNWDEDRKIFTEDRAGLFTSDILIEQDGDTADVSVRITAQETKDGWRFSSSVGGMALHNAEKNIWVLNAGGKETYFQWDEGSRSLSEMTRDDPPILGDDDDADEVIGETFTPVTDGTKADFTPLQQNVLTLVGEADLTFNTGGNDVRIQIRATDTIGEVMTRINGSNAGVTMSYNRLTDQFSLEARVAANGNPANTSLSVNGNGSNFFDIIRGSAAKDDLADDDNIPTVFRNGQQAIAFINGEEVRRNTNSFDFRGINITLNETFNTNLIIGTDDEPDRWEVIDKNDSINVNLSRDPTPVINTIREFIDSYNAIISRLEGLLNERKTSKEVSYKPLTDEEKQGMTEKQIEEWEAIAKKGILRNDQGIQNLVSSLRSSFFEQIEGVGVSPSQIGLSTGNFFDGTGGQIIIDEEKLRAAIERDPDMVADIFIRIDNSGPSPRGVGLLHKIDTLMRDYVNVSQSTSIRNLEDSFKRANEQLDRMQARMFAEEDKLYRQFAAMETAMSKLNQQGDWFSAMLGG
ncbi:MAG: flagellar filament capping protein FliD [Oscillospiraceae bacterium]|jgi:flagellar hook-associated protein 2|nr:flagellar filament capping protein FliD [Oscillospiraceae bacterium]